MARKADRPADGGDQTVIEPEKKKRSKLLLFLVPALVVGLLSGTALGVAQNDTLARVHAMLEQPGEADAAADSADAEAPDAEAEADPDALPDEFGAFSEMTGVIVNPAGTDGSRYLMLNLAFEGSEEAIATLKAREVVVKDRVLSHLSGQTMERLSRFAARDTLKQELRARVNGVLGEHAVSRLYFTQYVLQ